MKRVLAIWLPNWPVQRLAWSRPELAACAVVLHGSSRRGECVVACSAAAQNAGVCAGIPVAEAIALLAAPSGSLPLAGRAGEGGEAGARPEDQPSTRFTSPSPNLSPQGGGERRVVLEPHDSAADRAALVALAQWCHRFTPSVGIEEGDAPETLLLDATNLAPLYGGEPALVEQAARALRRRQLDARLALADTIGAAWALAHYGNLSPGLCPGVVERVSHPSWSNPRAEPGAETALPLAALRLTPDVLETLAHLGLACIGDLQALPREQLRSRLGPLVLLRLDQLTDAAQEVIPTVNPPEEFAVEQGFDYPITKSEAIRHTIENLLQRLAWLLAARRAGALAVECRFVCEAAPAVALQFGLFQPSACARHLLQIADLQLERLRLPAPAEAIEIRVLRHAPLVERQGALFDDERTLDGSRQLAALVDRLAGRLGGEAVVRARLVNDAQPELAYREESLVGSGRRGAKQRGRVRSEEPSRGKRGKEGQQERGALDRPLSLLAQPAALATMSVIPDGPPIYFRHAGKRHDVARHWGPERIETGWWRRQRAVRDYYRVETTEGRRFWLFRRRRDGRWFLHGG